MTEKIKSPVDTRTAWLKIDTLLNTWLLERQAVLILFNELPHKTQSLTLFCQLFIDYIAAGHFQIYQQLALAKEICMPNDPSLNPQLLKGISNTTFIGLDFNDKYAPEVSIEMEELLNDLSIVGEALADRMEYEDALIQHYFKMTESQVVCK